jgi:NADH dehydrogenase FAD-containing subunit
MVKEVKDKTVVVKNDKGEIEELPYGLLVWAAVSNMCLVPLHID